MKITVDYETLSYYIMRLRRLIQTKTEAELNDAKIQDILDQLDKLIQRSKS